MNRIFIFILLASGLGLISCGGSKSSIVPDGSWKFIADKWVDYGLDKDFIVLGDIGDEYRQLKLRVTDAPIKIYDMKIFYDNGDAQNIALRALIPQGGESRMIDLKGDKRHLRRIEFLFETAGVRRGKSRVAVWGRK